MAIRVYKYGLMPPTANADVIKKQLRLAHRYRNAHTEVTRFVRAYTRQRMGEHPVYEEAKRRYDEADEAVRDVMRAIDRGRAAAVRAHMEAHPEADAASKAKVAKSWKPTGELKEREKEARAAKKLAAATLKPARAAFFAEYDKAAVDAVEYSLRQNLRANRGDLYQGTDELYAAAAKQSRDMCQENGVSEDFDPSFRSFDGSGRLGVRPRPRPDDAPSDCWSGGKLLRTLMRIEDGALSWRAVRNPERQKTLRMRVNSGEKGAPIWGEWPMVMDRPLPAGRITGCAVSARRYGNRIKWTCEISVDVAEQDPRLLEGAADGSVAVDFGWRLRPGGAIRVAKWRGSDGQSGELVLDKYTVDGLRKPESLNAIRKHAFNGQTATVAAWLTEHAGRLPEPRPRWMQRAGAALEKWQWLADRGLKSIDDWKSIGRLAGLTSGWLKHVTQRLNVAENNELIDRIREYSRVWRDGMETRDAMAAFERLEVCVKRLYPAEEHAEAMLVAQLEAWRYWDQHMWAWVAQQSRGSREHRKHLYRNFGAMLARKYATLLTSDVVLSQIAKRKERGEDGYEQDVNDAASSNRTIASPGEARECIRYAFTVRGCQSVELPASDVSRVCHLCGSEEQWGADSPLEHTCKACGAQWDQDDNACRTMLAHTKAVEAAEALGSYRASLVEEKPKREAAWAKRHRLAAEKRARLEAEAAE